MYETIGWTVLTVLWTYVALYMVAWFFKISSRSKFYPTESEGYEICLWVAIFFSSAGHLVQIFISFVKDGDIPPIGFWITAVVCGITGFCCGISILVDWLVNVRKNLPER